MRFLDPVHTLSNAVLAELSSVLVVTRLYVARRFLVSSCLKSTSKRQVVSFGESQ